MRIAAELLPRIRASRRCETIRRFFRLATIQPTERLDALCEAPGGNPRGGGSLATHEALGHSRQPAYLPCSWLASSGRAARSLALSREMHIVRHDCKARAARMCGLCESGQVLTSGAAGGVERNRHDRHYERHAAAGVAHSDVDVVCRARVPDLRLDAAIIGPDSLGLVASPPDTWHIRISFNPRTTGRARGGPPDDLPAVRRRQPRRSQVLR